MKIVRFSLEDLEGMLVDRLCLGINEKYKFGVGYNPDGSLACLQMYLEEREPDE